jgi:hypothetical protein
MKQLLVTLRLSRWLLASSVLLFAISMHNAHSATPVAAAPPVVAKPNPGTPVAPVKGAPVLVTLPPVTNPNGDDDHDGIPNKNDMCPDSEPGEKVNEFGCNPDGDG